jgi:hypothetical protein
MDEHITFQLGVVVNRVVRQTLTLELSKNLAENSMRPVEQQSLSAGEAIPAI